VPFSTWQLPFDAINYCLEAAGITLADLDHVAYSYDPAQFPAFSPDRGGIEIPLNLAAFSAPDDGSSPWDPLFLSAVVNAPEQLRDGAPHHLQGRFKREAAALQRPAYRWHFIEHHLAHEASAFLCAPFSESAVLTMDGRGERVTTSYGVFRGGQYTRLKQIELPDSLGLLYEKVTHYLGFLHSSDEYKVMALASYGTPRYAEEFRRILRYHGAGEYTVEPVDLVARFGPARERGAPFEDRHFDLAHSLQLVLEETVLEMTRWLREQSGLDRLVMAGGVALNCVLNAKVRDDGAFTQVWVQPAAGDAGTALGAALWVDDRERGHPVREWHMEHAYLGPEYSDEDIEKFLIWSKLPYRRLTDVARQTAELLAQDKVIGWFQGRMEFGPRALGARSILAAPTSPTMQARLNQIKDREDFRPVAPVVMEEHAGAWFTGAKVAPYMLFVFKVNPAQAPRIPAVTHVDGTARVQTIRREQHPLYYDLLSAFHDITGVPILVNTSFNTRGEPIVASPRDAIESFWTSPLDALVIGSFLLEKAPS
jgi:carbamoyltransferase